MLLEIVLFLLIVVGVCLVSYKGAVHEFQILQKDWAPNITWSQMLDENVPIVIRNVDPEWQGLTWNYKATAKKSWPIVVLTEDGEYLKTTWSDWIQSAPGQPTLQNGEELARVAKLPVDTWTDGGFSRWSWLAPKRMEAHMLGPTEDTVLPVYKTTAVSTVIQSTDGAPLQIWLAHSGAVPNAVATDLAGNNPWTLSSEEIPWMDEVKFIEIKLRPGNALSIPAHWWIAARPMFGTEAPTKMADGSWFWIAEFHSPISYLVPTHKK